MSCQTKPKICEQYANRCAITVVDYVKGENTGSAFNVHAWKGDFLNCVRGGQWHACSLVNESVYQRHIPKEREFATEASCDGSRNGAQAMSFHEATAAGR